VTVCDYNGGTIQQIGSMQTVLKLWPFSRRLCWCHIL